MPHLRRRLYCHNAFSTGMGEREGQPHVVSAAHEAGLSRNLLPVRLSRNGRILTGKGEYLRRRQAHLGEQPAFPTEFSGARVQTACLSLLLSLYCKRSRKRKRSDHLSLLGRRRPPRAFGVIAESGRKQVWGIAKPKISDGFWSSFHAEIYASASRSRNGPICDNADRLLAGVQGGRQPGPRPSARCPDRGQRRSRAYL